MCAGNDNIHWLTTDRRQIIRFDMSDFQGNSAYAVYDNFKVENESLNYQLSSMGEYAGTAGQYVDVYLTEPMRTKVNHLDFCHF